MKDEKCYRTLDIILLVVVVFAMTVNMFCYHGFMMLVSIIEKDVFDGVMVIIEIVVLIG